MSRSRRQGKHIALSVTSVLSKELFTGRTNVDLLLDNSTSRSPSSTVPKLVSAKSLQGASQKKSNAK